MPSSSDVEICNVALTRVKRKRITDLADGTPSGNDCNAIFGPSRDAMLTGHAWNFAEGRKKLAQLSTAPVYIYDYAYQLPTDFLTVREVHDNDAGIGGVDYRIVGDQIHSSASQIYLSYTKAITDASALPADFRDALSDTLGAQLARTSTRRQELEARAEKSLRKAKSSDSIQDNPEYILDGSWVTERFR